MYLVKYHGGDIDDSYSTAIFVTVSKYTADKYAEKFNAILKKYKDHYKKYEDEQGWAKEEYVQEYSERWWQLQNITACYVEEIELRK
jgi:hypothetical protein